MIKLFPKKVIEILIFLIHSKSLNTKLIVPHIVVILTSNVKWKPPSLSELTLMILDMGLTHLGSEATISASQDLSSFLSFVKKGLIKFYH